MHALFFGKAQTAACTLLARADHVWMWPGISLTEKLRLNRGGCHAFLDHPAAWPGGKLFGCAALS
jgi:hypothetical protein